MLEKSRNVSVHRLLIGFSSIILLFVAIGVISIIEIRELSKRTQTIYYHPLVVSNASLNASVSIIKMHRSMKDVVLFEFPSEINIAMFRLSVMRKVTFYRADRFCVTLQNVSRWRKNGTG